MAKINGATLIARSLKEQGIDHLFGVVGFPVGPIAEAAQKEGINYVGMRNEQAASYAAQAYGYMTGRPGLHRCNRTWRCAWSGRISKCSTELLANDTNRWRFSNLPRWNGCFPRRATGSYHKSIL